MSIQKDLIGQKYGRLLVVRKCDFKIGNRITWHCKCDCGNTNIINVRGLHLRNKHTKSCGCLQVEKIKQTGYENKKHNIYDLSGEYGVGYTNKGEEFYFDLEDYDKIKDYCWRTDTKGYIICNDNDNPCGQTTIQFHRIVTNITNPNIQIDHISHKNNDNRKSQLRIANNSMNQINQGVQCNNKTGVTGVQWHERDSIYESLITVNKKRIYLGRYNDFEEAVKVRKEAEEKYFGEYSYDNSMKTGAQDA